MSDYIKRENAKRAVWGCTRDTGIDEAPFEYAEGLLEDVPAEDVEPVVRCKDCRHWCEMQNSAGACLRHSVIDGSWWTGTDSTDYCSFAERRDDDE